MFTCDRYVVYSVIDGGYFNSIILIWGEKGGSIDLLKALNSTVIKHI